VGEQLGVGEWGADHVICAGFERAQHLGCPVAGADPQHSHGTVYLSAELARAQRAQRAKSLCPVAVSEEDEIDIPVGASGAEEPGVAHRVNVEAVEGQLLGDRLVSVSAAVEDEGDVFGGCKHVGWTPTVAGLEGEAVRHHVARSSCPAWQREP